MKTALKNLLRESKTDLSEIAAVAITNQMGIGDVIDREIPITGVMGDSHAALFAQNCFKKGMAKATFETAWMNWAICFQ